jgi:hypothetical protein
MPKRPLQQRRSEVMFFPKPEGIFPTGVNNHSQLSSFIHPSWSKCFLQRWLIHELGIWMKSKHYLVDFPSGSLGGTRFLSHLKWRKTVATTHVAGGMDAYL